MFILGTPSPRTDRQTDRRRSGHRKTRGFCWLYASQRRYFLSRARCRCEGRPARGQDGGYGCETPLKYSIFIFATQFHGLRQPRGHTVVVTLRVQHLTESRGGRGMRWELEMRSEWGPVRLPQPCPAVPTHHMTFPVTGKALRRGVVSKLL